jgi:hypothetical protein
MPSDGKTIVFVSSAADADVRDERAAARLAIDKVGMRFSGMELWPAGGDSSVLNLSLEELHDSHIFVGVFGERCGEVTRREFDEAVKIGMKRILFFRRPAGTPSVDTTVVNSIPPKDRTVDQQRLAELHASVAKPDSPKNEYFGDAKDLAFLVSVALNRHNQTTANTGRLSSASQLRPKIPEYLETLCNRNDQQTQIRELLEASVARKQKLLIVGLRGPRLEGHHSFVDWYHFLRLHADYVSANGSREVVASHGESRRRDILSIAWPHATGVSLDGRFNDLRDKLARKLLNTDKPPSDDVKLDSAIKQALAGVRQHLTVRHTIISGQCSNDESDLLARWLDYWKTLALPFDGMRTTVFFCLREDHSGLINSFFARSRMKACIAALEARKSTTLICPPELRPPNRTDVDVWAEERCPEYFSELDVEVLKREAGRPFENQERIPFETVKAKLREALITAHEQYKR